MKLLLITGALLFTCATSLFATTYVSEALGVTDSNNQPVTQLFGCDGNPGGGPVAVSQSLILGQSDNNKWISFTSGEQAIFGFGLNPAVDSVFVGVLANGADETGLLFGRAQAGDPWVFLGMLTEPAVGALGDPPNIETFSLVGTGLTSVGQVKIVSNSSAGTFSGLDIHSIGADNAVSLSSHFWKATITLPVRYAGTTPAGKHTILTKTLKSSDIINLALGRPLTTKVDAKSEILALSGNAASPGIGSQIVIVNPTTRAKVAAVFSLPTFDVIFANPPKDNAAVMYMLGNIQATTAGSPAQNGFDVTGISIAGAGNVTSAGAFPIASTALCGEIKFRIGGVAFNGLVTKGALSVSGPSLGTLAP
jgi:hypothetical protein